MNKKSSNGIIIIEEQGDDVQSIIDYIKYLDRDDRYYIISMQTAFSKVILLKNFISRKDATRFVLITHSAIEVSGKAMLTVFSGFGRYWKLLTVFKIFPVWLQDRLVGPFIYLVLKIFCSREIIKDHDDKDRLRKTESARVSENA